MAVSATSHEASKSRLASGLNLGTLLVAVILTAVVSFLVGRLVVNLVQQQAITSLFGARLEAIALIDTRDRQHAVFLSQIAAQEDIQQATLVDGSPVSLARLENVAATNDADTLILLDRQANVSVRLDAIRSPDLITISTYQSMSGDNYGSWSIVQSALSSDPLVADSTYSAITDAPGGPTLMTSIPVVTRNADNRLQVSGVAIVGSSLERLLLAARTQSNIDLVFLTPEQQLITSTANDWQEINSDVIEQGLYEELMATRFIDTGEPTYLLNKQYYVTFEELDLRGNVIGSVGAIQPTRLPLERANPNLTAAALAALGVLFVVSALIIRQRMLLPLGQLISISKEVATEQPKTGSELRTLVDTFQTMVTELQTANASLEEENLKSKAILESIGDGVIVRDHEGQVILANPSATSMLRQIELPQEQILDEAAQGRNKFDAGDSVLQVACTFLGIPGVRDVFVINDISDEEFAARTKSNFLNQIGHELRTPLTSLMSYADILHSQGDRLPEDIRRQATQTIFDQGETLGMIINHLIEVTEIETGLLTLKPQPTDLRSTVSQALTQINLPHDTTINLNLADAQAIVNLDVELFLRAVKALLLNAVHYSSPTGTVTIIVESHSNYADLSVHDDGMGILEKDLPHIFERFYRGTPRDATGNEIDVRGTGMGLFMAKSVVEAHKGEVLVDSTVGVGSTFTIRLPLAQQ